MNGWYSELTKEKGPNETNKTIQNNVTWEEKFMKKKILSILMASMMVFGLVACGGNTAKTDGAGDTSAPSSSSSGDLIKVGIINNDPNESGYRTANDKDMKAMFTKENGYDASFAYSLKNDEQITAAQKFIQDGVDYLLLSAADTSGWDSVLKDAQDAGTQVILFDRVIDADESLYAASIVSDMDKEGQTACDWLKAQNLDEYNIIHIQGVMGSAAQKGRSGALTDMAASEGWNIVNEQTAEWNAEKAQQIVQSVIDSGEKFNVIYAENDELDTMVKKVVSASLPMEYFAGKWIAGGVHQITSDEFTLRKQTNYNLIVVGFNNGATTAPYLFPFYTDEPTGVDAIAANNDNGKAPVFSIDGKMVSKTSDSETLNKLGDGEDLRGGGIPIDPVLGGREIGRAHV